MHLVTARLTGDLIALAGTAAPTSARADQIRDVLTDHGLRSVSDERVTALAGQLDALAATVHAHVASALGLPARPAEASSLSDAQPEPGSTRVYWLREDGRDEQHWLADVPTEMLRAVADGRTPERALDDWVVEHGVLLTPTVIELDEDDTSCARVAETWLRSDVFDYLECWPEATFPRPLSD